MAFYNKRRKKTKFEGGLYHGNLHLDNNYPSIKPEIQFFTPNGRFAVNTSLCILLNTVQDSKHWESGYTLINMLEALIYYMTIQESHSGGIADSKVKKKEKNMPKILLYLNATNVV